jgi:hypothetical protein
MPIFSAQELRRINTELYTSQVNGCRCCIESRDAFYNLKAYQMMSDEEILMSEEREQKYDSQQRQILLKEYTAHKEDARKTIIKTK